MAGEGVRPLPRARRWATVARRAAVSRAMAVAFAAACNLVLPTHTPEGALLWRPDKYGGGSTGGTSESRRRGGGGVPTAVASPPPLGSDIHPITAASGLPNGGTALSPESTAWVASLAAFTRWDAARFLDIAECGGYGGEETHAFFPAYPFAVRTSATALERALPTGASLPWDEALVVAAVGVTAASFVGAAVGLYLLSVAVLGSEPRAFCAATLFCVNPASVFMATAYSESLFACASFWGAFALVTAWRCDGRHGADVAAGGAPSVLAAATAGGGNGWCLVRPAVATVCAAALFAAASATRSIGVANAAVGCWVIVKWAVAAVGGGGRRALVATAADKGGGGSSGGGGGGKTVVLAAALAAAVVVAAAALAPSALFDAYGRSRLCPAQVGAGDGQVRTAGSGGRPAWCDTGTTVYAHIQRAHWNVGPFRYWRLKQLPNFALAAPAALLCWDCVAAHARHVMSRQRPLAAVASADAWGARLDGGRRGGFGRGPVLPHAALPFVAAWAGVTALAVVVAHVQVLTRLVCAACPAAFWHAEAALRERPSMRWPIVATLVGFNVVGTAMHANFYPWT